MINMTFGVLTTTYNTWNLSSNCIKNCFTYADDRIDRFIVVDDCSSIPFTNEFGGITLIRNQKNEGLTKSLNIGIQSINTDLIAIFDSDAWPLENYILETKAFFTNNLEIGIAVYDTQNERGEPLLSYEAEPDVMSVLLGQRLYGKYQKLWRKESKQITLYTCAMVIRKQVLEQIGGFDEKYDWLELDHDICMRATRKGWKMGVIPVKAFHKGSGTSQKVANRVIRFYKNRVRLLMKFNKYPYKFALNSLVAIRLVVEYIFIKTIGIFMYSKDIRKDKAYSRYELAKWFMSGGIKKI